MILPRLLGVIGVIILLSSPSSCRGWQPLHRPPITIRILQLLKASSLFRDQSLNCLRAVPPTSDGDGDGDGDGDDENILPSMENKKEAAVNKPPQSRLARLAEDWLEEEEEDELLKYWERFEDKTAQSAPNNRESIDKDDSSSSALLLTTEELLERYLDSRGIRRGEELAHRVEIEASIQAAQTANTAEEALKALETVQPWLQVHTRLGGIALVEYLTALWQKEDGGALDEELCRALLKNPHDVVVSKVKRLLKSKEPPPRQPSLWSGIFSKDGTGGNGWWW
jgi:hypothetical protein